MTLLRISRRVSAAADRPASYGNQIMSSTRPSCWTQISMVDVINFAADHEMSMTFTGELNWQCLRPSAIDFYSKNEKLLFEPSFLYLGVTYALHLLLVGKPVVDFIFVVNELFSLFPTVEMLWAEIGKSRHFSKGLGHFECRFQREGGIAHQPLLVSEDWSDCRFVWYQNIRSSSFSFVTIHVSDRQTDRQTDIRTDRQNCDSNTMRCITWSRTVKMRVRV